MTPRAWIPLCSSSLVLTLAAPLAGMQAQFVPIGGLGPGGSAARAVNRDGSAVIGHSSLAAGPTAWRWTAAGGMAALGDLPGGGARSYALDISDDGAVVVGYSDSSLQFEEPFRWTHATGMVGLGALPGGLASQARATDSDGDVIVGAGSFTSGPMAALYWTPASGLTPLLTDASAHDVDRDGSVVVGLARTGAVWHAFRWTAVGGALDLGDLPGGGDHSQAQAVTPDGTVVVGISLSGTGSEAFRWTAAGGMVGLASPPFFATEALDVSADGAIIVGGSYDPNTFDIAVIWTQATGMVALKDYLIALGATGLAGWEITSANGISADGNAIVGMAKPPGPSDPQAFIAYLTPPTFPIGSPYCDPAVPNSSGAPAVLGASGLVVALDNDVTLSASQLPPNQFGYFLVGPTQGFAAGPGGSQGNLCLAGSIGRYNRPGEVLSSGPGGAFELLLDLTDTPAPMGSVAVGATQTWNFQCWFRDANPGPTSNFSNGLSIEFR